MFHETVRRQANLLSDYILSENESKDEKINTEIILVVEDNDEMLSFIVYQLRNHFAVEKAVDGAKLIQNGKCRIGEVGYLVEINSSSHFIKLFQKQFGMTPREFVRQQQKPEQLEGD
jgi:YesN/AraC family two-component response regulator